MEAWWDKSESASSHQVFLPESQITTEPEKYNEETKASEPICNQQETKSPQLIKTKVSSSDGGHPSSSQSPLSAAGRSVREFEGQTSQTRKGGQPEEEEDLQDTQAAYLCQSELLHRPEVSQSKPPDNPKKRTVKRPRNEALWKANIRKFKRQHGEEYVDRNGKIHRERRMGYGCTEACKLKCMSKFSEEERSALHSLYWRFSEAQKRHFYTQHVERINKMRQTVPTKDKKRNRNFTYFYFLESKGVKTKVCKRFFSDTLDIHNKIQFEYVVNNDGEVS